MKARWSRMSSAEMTLIGLYNYDHELFDKMEMPDGVQKDLVIDAILMNGGEYEVLYPNTDLLKELIGSWSRQWSNVFTNWNKVTNDINDVAPLENYDRFEDWTDRGNASHNETANHTGSNSQTDHNTTTDSRHGNDEFSATNSSSSSESGNTVNQISADDATNFVNRDKADISNSQSTNGTSSNQTISNSNGSNEYNGTISGSDNARDTKDSSDTNSSVHTGHIHGNIGVTTAAQMFQSFYDVMRTYGNIYESISYIFLQNFTIPIL